MNNWQEKYPKTFRDFEGWLVDKYELEMNFELTLRTSDFDCAFGHLLKFFSENGIEIERNIIDANDIRYDVSLLNHYYRHIEGNLKTPEEACEKAFKILEGKK